MAIPKQSEKRGSLASALANRVRDLHRLDASAGEVETALGIRRDETSVTFGDSQTVFDYVQLINLLTNRLDIKLANILNNVGGEPASAQSEGVREAARAMPSQAMRDQTHSPRPTIHSSEARPSHVDSFRQGVACELKAQQEQLASIKAQITSSYDYIVKAIDEQRAKRTEDNRHISETFEALAARIGEVAIAQGGDGSLVQEVREAMHKYVAMNDAIAGLSARINEIAGRPAKPKKTSPKPKKAA